MRILDSQFSEEEIAEKLKIGLQELERRKNESEYSLKNHTIGRILTVTDGVIADPDQRKAVKDLINDAFWGSSSPSTLDNMNRSLEAQLFEYLTGEELWTEDKLPQNVKYNLFEDKLK